MKNLSCDHCNHTLLDFITHISVSGLGGSRLSHHILGEEQGKR